MCRYHEASWQRVAAVGINKAVIPTLSWTAMSF
jgi:hypothetical protein